MICIALGFALAAGGGYLAHSLALVLDFQQSARDVLLGETLIWWLLLAYVLLIAIPFVPGAELGLLMIAVLEPPIVGHVYLATVAALLLSFTVGRIIPADLLRPIATRLDIDALIRDADARPVDAAPTRIAWWRNRLLRYRCCTLIVLINTPGNSVIGGGGGIAMAAGASRLFSYAEFVASVLIAVAPIPVLVLATHWML